MKNQPPNANCMNYRIKFANGWSSGAVLRYGRSTGKIKDKVV
ncbi:hypothetical protein [Sphingobacterium sp. HMA12]|nr:hypothetical protein [Sphingobacterium sp. HMA12]